MVCPWLDIYIYIYSLVGIYRKQSEGDGFTHAKNMKGKRSVYQFQAPGEAWLKQRLKPFKRQWCCSMQSNRQAGFSQIFIMYFCGQFPSESRKWDPARIMWAWKTDHLNDMTNVIWKSWPCGWCNIVSVCSMLLTIASHVIHKEWTFWLTSWFDFLCTVYLNVHLMKFEICDANEGWNEKPLEYVTDTNCAVLNSVHSGGVWIRLPVVHDKTDKTQLRISLTSRESDIALWLWETLRRGMWYSQIYHTRMMGSESCILYKRIANYLRSKSNIPYNLY